jgi:hypothetical protein
MQMFANLAIEIVIFEQLKNFNGGKFSFQMVEHLLTKTKNTPKKVL